MDGVKYAETIDIFLRHSNSKPATNNISQLSLHFLIYGSEHIVVNYCICLQYWQVHEIL